jgi:polyhydroxyalkanoate synthesis regulator phasin
MNTDTLLQLFQQGFRAAIGTTITLANTLKNPESFPQTWTRLTENPTGFAQELIDKGAVTEQEARQVVDSLWSQNNSPSSMTITTTATTVTPDVQAELKDLMIELAAIRSEIAQLRSDSNS